MAQTLARHGAAAFSEPPPEARSVEALDEPYLRRLVEALGAAKVAALIARLPADAHAYRERVARGQEAGDLAATQAAAHALKGVAVSLGLTALADVTGAIEEACRGGTADDLVTLCARLDGCLDDAIACLRAFDP